MTRNENIAMFAAAEMQRIFKIKCHVNCVDKDSGKIFYLVETNDYGSFGFNSYIVEDNAELTTKQLYKEITNLWLEMLKR